MFVLCSVEDSKNWQQLKEKSQVNWVSKLDDAAGKKISHVADKVDPESILSFCSNHRDATVIVVVNTGIVQIAEMLQDQESQDIEAATERLQHLLDVHAKNRKQIKLVPYSSVYTTQLKDEYHAGLISLEKGLKDGVTGQLELALAFYIVNTNRILSKLSQKLFASFALSAPDEHFEIDVKAILDGQREVLESQKGLLDDRQYIFSQLQGAQEAYEKQHDDLKQSENKRRDALRQSDRKLKEYRKFHKKEIASIRTGAKKAEQKLQREIDFLNGSLSKSRLVGNKVLLQLAEAKLVKQTRLTKMARNLEKLLKPFDKIPPQVQENRLNISVLQLSDLFDAEWYLEQYPDVAAAQVEPAEHYLMSGADEGRYPSQYFDGQAYKQRYPDVAENKINPLIHYIKYGSEEGRIITPVPTSGS